MGTTAGWTPVTDILWERIPPTMIISLISVAIVWMIAIPIGIYSATHQYSILDYIFTFIGFIGIATPGFLLALLLAWLIFSNFNFSPLGLYTQKYMDAPWSTAKFIDLLKHLILPLLVVGLGNTGGTIRTVRNNLLDELNKQYVITARAKGMSEWKLVLKYPVRMAICADRLEVRTRWERQQAGRRLPTSCGSVSRPP